MKRMQEQITGGFQRSMAFRIIAGAVILLVLFTVLVGAVGYARFTDSLTAEYNDAAFRTAETAATLVNADHIQQYLDSAGEDPEYQVTLERLNTLCQKQNVTLLYVIDVDTSDYLHFTCVFNTVNENSDYDPWPIGYQRETTNEEYAEIYRQIYEEGMKRGTIERTDHLRGKEPHITSLIPLTGADGAVKSILCVQRPMSELVGGRQLYLVTVGIIGLVLAALASVWAGLYLRKEVIRPIDAISREADRFARETCLSSPLKDLSSTREIKTLAHAIDKMEADTVQAMERLTEITAEKERIGTELALATRIQADMLPNIYPAFPERPEFDIFATMDPAKEVGGDFYDFFLIDDTHLGIVMADVSGKGVPAALFMMVSRILVQNYAMTGRSPAEVLQAANEQICANNREEMFVTVWFGSLDTETGVITAANAGHEYPVLMQPGGAFALVKDKHGFVLGGMEGVRYKEYALRLEPGAKLFLYTDGVPEATDGKNEMFGPERMLDALNREPDAPLETILKNVRAAVNAFVGDAEQFDDLTMLCMEYRGIKNETGAEITK